MKSQFLLDPSVIYLNHGSFGACPKPIFEDYQRWQLELEREPVQFITKNSWTYLRNAKEALAGYIHCHADDLFFTPNPTFAINTIMRSLKLQPGDEILTSNHEYGAMDRTWSFFCKKTGARYVRQPISLPVQSKEQLIAEFWKGYGPKTKVIFLNQMSSATALIFPVKEICEKARALGLIIIIDGAHVPGHIDLDLSALEVDFYTGTLHKWMLTPKGSSFLYVRKAHQDQLDPLIVSWGYESEMPGKSQFLDYHEQQGTRDISAFLTAPAAIRFLKENNWKGKAAQCRKLVLETYPDFCALLQSDPICPVDEAFLGQMASIPIRTDKPAALKEHLFDRYRIEIPVMRLNDAVYLRYSVQAYNSLEDLERLKEALLDIQNRTDFLK